MVRYFTPEEVSPLDLASIAGIDITTEQPLRATIQYIGKLVNELEQLTDEIEATDQ